MIPPARSLRAALSKPFVPILFFFGGVTYDSLTLTRIDRLLDNVVLLVYLTILGALIVFTARASSFHSPLAARLRPYAPMAIQFLLGSLFSAYAIFYSQSASWTATAVFFLVLMAFLVGNEFLRDRLSSLTLLVSLYALVSFSFFTFFLPVLTGFMNTAVFLTGAVLSAALSLWTVRLANRGEPARSPGRAMQPGLPAVAIVAVLVGFYFLNWIPPVPLSLKFGGIYQSISKADGRFRLSYGKGPWYQFWKRSDDPLPSSVPAYCFTAVFAPVDLRTTIYHRWQYRQGRDGDRQFTTTDRLGFPISGGRDEGYRGYTVKQRVIPGDWRVDVETADGRIIGRIAFSVTEPTGVPVETETLTY